MRLIIDSVIDVGKEVDRRTGLFTEVDVKPVQEDVVPIRDALEVGLKVINHIKHGRVGRVGFKLELRVFSRKERAGGHGDLRGRGCEK